MQFTDTHCHIQTIDQSLPDEDNMYERWQKAGISDSQTVIDNATADGVTRLICVGCTLEDSQAAIELAAKQTSCWATIGIHPHEAQHYDAAKQAKFKTLASQPKVVAIGECGLDYYYEHSPKATQFELLKMQLQLAADHNLPLIFHVRDAFEDFWPIFDQFSGLKGVIHSFTGTDADLEQILQRNLHVGLNGIMTFTKDSTQLKTAKTVPLSKLLLETDAPFLTPAPFRSKICEPKHVRVTAEFLSNLRGESLEELAAATTQNAQTLFGL